MNATFMATFGLVLVIEGLLPFIAPRIWRDTFRRLIEMADGQLRFIGLGSMVIGLVVLWMSQ